MHADDALESLRNGNQAFVSGNLSLESFVRSSGRPDLPQIQEPSAIVLGCSDARVPAEIIFGQGLGDLFVIRVAGNIVASSQVGSVEFAAEKFGTRLVVVLGHSDCGAVTATLQELQNPTGEISRNVQTIVNSVRPSVEALLNTELRDDWKNLLSHSVKANVIASVNHLRHGSEVLEILIKNQGLRVVGAVYSLETGLVTFYEDE